MDTPVTDPNGEKQNLKIKDEDIVAVVKFNVSRDEFLELAQKFIIESSNVETGRLKPPFETATMYVLGLVKGEVRNEIIIVKDKKQESLPEIHLPDSAG